MEDLNKELIMFNLGYLKSLYGVVKIYKLKFIILTIMLTIIVVLLTTLFNLYSFFNTYKEIHSGFVPNMIYLDDKKSTKEQFLSKFSQDILDKSLYGYYDTKSVNISSSNEVLISQKEIYQFNYYDKKIEPMFVKDTKNGTTEKIEIKDIKHSRIYYEIKTNRLSISKGKHKLYFKDKFMDVKVKNYKTYSKLLFDIKNSDFNTYYSVMTSYLNQFLNLNRTGISNQYKNNKQISKELLKLKTRYDDTIRTYIKLLNTKDIVLASETLYDEISTFHRKSIKLDIDDGKTTKNKILINKLLFQNENIDSNNLNSFILTKAKDKGSNTDIVKKHFIFFYGEDKGFQENLKKELLLTNSDMIPSILVQEKVAFYAILILILIFIMITTIILFTLLNSFYKTYSREIFFLKSYGFKTKLFTLFYIFALLIGLFISNILLDDYFGFINTVLSQYFFPEIKFSYYYNYIFGIFTVILLWLFLSESSIFNRLSYNTKEEL